MAPLIPKLRGHFAEFLNDASSVGLRILSSSTCVGLRYGYRINNSGFSWHMAHALPYLNSVRITSSSCMADLPTIPLPCLHAAFRSAPALSTCVPTVLLSCSAGICTRCPSATAFALTLGPDLPREDQLYPGNLGYSAGRILTPLSLLIPAFSLQYTPRLLTVPLRRIFNAPLPMECNQYLPYASASAFWKWGSDCRTFHSLLRLFAFDSYQMKYYELTFANRHLILFVMMDIDYIPSLSFGVVF